MTVDRRSALGIALSHARSVLGLSLDELASRVGVSARTLGRWERGETSVAKRMQGRLMAGLAHAGLEDRAALLAALGLAPPAAETPPPLPPPLPPPSKADVRSALDRAMFVAAERERVTASRARAIVVDVLRELARLDVSSKLAADALSDGA
jgi:transcriptional regulator with XRE-family HTH domain